MKKYLPLIGIVAAVIIVGLGILLMNKEDEPANSTNGNTNTAPSTPPASTDTTPPASPSPATTNEVEMENEAFTPANITVKKGTTVTWTNKDNTLHDIVADSGSGPNSPDMEDGDTYSFNFDSVGEFSYHCSYHPSMVGKVTVTE